MPGARRSPRRKLAAAKGRLFLFVISAGPPGEGDAAEARVLLVYVRAAAPQDGAVMALAELDRRGWRQADIQGAKEVSADPEDEPDPHAREAAAKAMQAGFSFIVYF